MGTARTSVAGRLTPGQIVTMSRRPTDTRMDRSVTIPSKRLAAIAALVLTLAACSNETAPTGWIPSDGAIKGVITTTSVFPAPSRASVPAAPARGGQVRELPTPPSVAALLHRDRKSVV